MSSICSNKKFLENLAYHSAKWAGSPWAYIVAVSFTLIWLGSGPFMKYSADWELIMKTAGGAVTFLMVFLIQRSQDKNSLAMQIKLNEIIASLQGANNRIISIEDLSEGEVNLLQKNYQSLATHIQQDEEISTHSVSMQEVVHKMEEALEAAEAISSAPA